MLCEWLTTDFLKKCKSCSLCALILCYDGIVEEPTRMLFLFPHSKNAPTKAAGAFLLLNETLEIVDDVLNFKNIADEA